MGLGVSVLKKWLQISSVVIILGLVSWLGVYLYLNSYVSYVPITCLEGQGLQENPKLNTPAHQKSIKEVLNNQSYVKWKVKGRKVMIQRKMTMGDFNRNYLWNLTIKADHPEERLHEIDRTEYERLMKEMDKEAEKTKASQ
jgi:hypothetical protein